LHKPLPAKD